MKKVLLVIGHRAEKPGAVNAASELRDHDISEFMFNEQLAKFIEAKNFTGIKIELFYRRSYRTLVDDINTCNADLIISLHCNSAAPSASGKYASGTEMLYYYKSPRSKLMAEIFQKHIVDYLELPDRGLKSKQVEDRGGSLLKYTNAPCIICEPFFINNNLDFSKGSFDMDDLSEAYGQAIIEAVQKV